MVMTRLNSGDGAGNSDIEPTGSLIAGRAGLISSTYGGLAGLANVHELFMYGLLLVGCTVHKSKRNIYGLQRVSGSQHGALR